MLSNDSQQLILTSIPKIGSHTSVSEPISFSKQGRPFLDKFRQSDVLAKLLKRGNNYQLIPQSLCIYKDTLNTLVDSH